MRFALVLLILFTATVVSRGESRRLIMKIRDMETLLKTRLPRGPVPPSGPSPCHNKLDPFKEGKFYRFHKNDITCP